MGFDLRHKTALISGAGQGIGRGIAEVLAEAGAHVFLCDVDDENGNKTVEEMRSRGLSADYLHADVSIPEQVELFVQFALQKTGRIDIVVNNAAVTIGKQHDTLDADQQEWDSNYQVGLMGTMHLTKFSLPAMIRQKCGSVIVISSIHALTGFSESTPYSSIKAAQLGFVRCAAMDYGKHNIRVNAICPGVIKVRYSPEPGSAAYEKHLRRTMLGRIGDPRDIGHAALYLASDESSYVTGAVLPVDGGWTAM